MLKLGARGLGVVAALWAAALTGCGTVEPMEDTAAQGSTEQAIQACDPYNPHCNVGTTCVRGSCLKSCDPSDPLCGSGQVCCVEYAQPGEPVVMPYCTSYCPSN